jgi:radical SAM superfamily enzyme YgiQ (UPF0313 family)
MSHAELLNIISWLKIKFSQISIAVLENSQAVTGYSLSHVSSDFFGAGADALICGEPYSNWREIKISLLLKKDNFKRLPNVITRNSTGLPIRVFEPLTRYPVPAWDLINLQSYWDLPYSHGPKTPKFLPILTSRGCPYPCEFCVVPETNNKRWHGNTPEATVDEIIELRDRYGVFDFQVEDLNPTVRHQRWERICELILEKDVGIRFYFVSGTKAETVHLDRIPLFAKAGCKYISFSPESGSAGVMKLIGKKFNQLHGLELVNQCRKYKIRTQACFLVGYPGETELDFQYSKKYMKKLIRSGLDEVAVFVVAPFAGSKLYEKKLISISNKVAVPSFSPKGRSDYHIIEKRRRELIRAFFVEKLRMGSDLWMQAFRALFGTPQTKMENLPLRIVYICFIIIRMYFSRAFGGKHEV